MMRVLWGIAVVISLVGCGPSYIILEISSELVIPADVDSLQVVTLNPKDLTDELANVELPLDDSLSFPLEVLLEPSSETPEELQQRVTARLEGVPKAGKEFKHKWVSHRISRAKITLESF